MNTSLDLELVSFLYTKVVKQTLHFVNMPVLQSELEKHYCHTEVDEATEEK